MTIKRTPSVIGPTDPDVARSLQANLKQAAIIANGKPTVSNSELILPSTTVRATATSVTLNTSANNQPSDTVTVYPSSGNVYVSSIDQTIKQNIVNQTGVYSIIAGNNISISSTGAGGTGNVTINASGGGSGSTGNITFSGTTMSGPTGSSDSYSIYIQPSADFTNTLQIYPTADNDIHLFEKLGNAITLGNYGESQLSVWGPNSPNANITIQSNGNIWEFGEDGGTIFPTLNVQRGDNPSDTITGQTLLFGDNTQEAIISTADGTVSNENSQRLVINPGQGYDYGEGGDIYLWAGRGGDGSGSGGDIKIRGGQGGANTTGGIGGSGGYIRIEAGDSATTGGSPGYVDINGGNSAIAGGGYVEILGGQGATVGGDANLKGGYGYNDRGGNVNIWGGGSANGQANEGNVNIQTGGNTWTFDPSGNLTLPANTFAVNYANGTQVSMGGGGNSSQISNGNSNVSVPTSSDNVYINVNSGSSKQWIFDTSGNLRTPGNVNIYGAINFPQQVSSLNWSTYNIELSQYGRINTNVDFFANANTIGALYLKGDGSNITNVNAVQVVNGTSNVQVPTTNGNVVVTVNSTNQWLFDTTGNLTFPGNLVIAGNTNVFGTDAALIQPTDDKPLIALSSGANGAIATTWVEDIGNIGTSNIAAVYANPIPGSGIVRIAVGQNGGAGPNLWDFNQDGNLTLPSGGIIHETNIPGGVLTGNTIVLKPQGGTNADQQLLVYPTAIGADFNHLHLTSGNLYNTELFLGSDDLYVKLANTGNIVLNSNDGTGNAGTWTFGTNDSLTLPRNSIISEVTPATGAAASVNVKQSESSIPNGLFVSLPPATVTNYNVPGTDIIVTVTWVTNGPTLYAPRFAVVDGGTGHTGGGEFGGGDVLTVPYVDMGITGGGNWTWYVETIASNLILEAGLNSWTFTGDGNLTLPTGGQIIVSGGLVANVASPAPTINGFSITNSVGISGTGNVSGNNISAIGQITSTKAGNLSTGGGQLYLNGSGNNRIDFNTNGTGAPSFTTRSAGAKVVLYPSIGASATDYAMGVDSGTLWLGIPSADGGQFFKWYGGTTELANLSGTGILNVTGNITGANLLGPHANGNSNINIPAANGNVNISAVGNANIVVVTGTGANIAGTLNVTGNITGNTNGFAIGYLNIPQVAASDTTIALTDAGKHYYSTSAGNFTLTVPNNTTTSFATGTAISIVVQSAGNVLVNAASGVTLYMAGNSTAANRVVSNYGMATLMKVATETWFINGTGVA